MYQLIKKDLLIQKKSVILSLFLIIFFSLYFSKMGAAGLTLSVFAVTYMLTLGASAIDEKNNSDKLLISLPIRKVTIVLSKYLSVFVFSLYVILMNYLIRILIHVLHLPVNVIPFTFAGILGSVIAPMLFCSISLPLIFKYGYLKSRMANLLLFFLIVIGGTALVDKALQNYPSLENLLIGKSSVEMIIVTLIPAVIIFVLSFLLSLSFYKNREF